MPRTSTGAPRTARSCGSRSSVSDTPKLEDVRRELGQRRALALRERDVAREGLALELLDDGREAVRGRVDVGVVNLVRVAREDDLRGFPDARDDGLHFVGRQVLRLVDDDELVRDRAAADVRQRLDLDEAHVDELLVGAPALALLALRQAHEVLDVVVDGLHPRVELLFYRPREVADVAAQRKDGPRDEQLRVELLLDDLLQARGDREHGLARAGLAHEGHELDVVGQEEVERAVLLLVARADAPDALLDLAQRHELLRVAVEAAERAVRRVLLVAQQDVLVGLEGGLGEVERVLRVEGVDVGGRDGQLRHARVQLVHVDALGLEVHRGEAQRVGADAEVDVLRDEDRGLALVGVAHVERHHEDEVVGDLALAQRRRHRARRRGDAQAAAVRQGRAVRQPRPLGAQPVEQARDLARVAAQLRGLFLEVVDLLDDEDGNDDFVVGELRDGAWVVQQDVGVENEVLHVPPRKETKRRKETKGRGPAGGRRATDVYFLSAAALAALPRVIVTFVSETSLFGLSPGERGTRAISPTSETGSHCPKIV